MQYRKSFLQIMCFCTLVTAGHAAVVNDTTFIEKPVSLHTANGDLHGTLMLPDTPGGGVVALILPGSGPTDRDGNAPGMKNNCLKLLAHDLSVKGIPSVRIDKRGVGESAGAMTAESDLRFDTYVQDAIAWINLLHHDFKKIVVIGHSEGSLIGMIAAGNIADAYVSLDGAGESADKLLKTQLAAQPKAVQDLCFPMIDTLAGGKTLSAVDPGLYSLFRPGVQPYLISWFRYDPVVEIKKLKIPVLLIQGASDLQVAASDAQALKAAKPDAQLVVINGMNHVLKIVGDDRQSNLAAYSSPELPIPTQLTNEIVKFIHAVH